MEGRWRMKEEMNRGGTGTRDEERVTRLWTTQGTKSKFYKCLGQSILHLTTFSQIIWDIWMIPREGLSFQHLKSFKIGSRVSEHRENWKGGVGGFGKGVWGRDRQKEERRGTVRKANLSSPPVIWRILSFVQESLLQVLQVFFFSSFPADSLVHWRRTERGEFIPCRPNINSFSAVVI